jgi:hypothetical protein
MTRTRRIALLVLMDVTVFLFAVFVHLDFYPGIGTYGWSVGTNTHYCSLEMVSGSPEFSCESAN